MFVIKNNLLQKNVEKVMTSNLTTRY